MLGVARAGDGAFVGVVPIEVGLDHKARDRHEVIDFADGHEVGVAVVRRVNPRRRRGTAELPTAGLIYSP